MKNTIAILISVIVLCSSACARIDEDYAYLSVNIEPENHDPFSPRPSRMGQITVHINGNHWGYVINNSAGPIDKYLFDGTNTLKVSGHATGKVRLNLVSTPTYGERPSNSILSQTLSVQDNGEINSVYDFAVKRPTSRSYSLEDITLTDRGIIENELRPIILSIYSYCADEKKRQFLKTTLAGYRLHSPHAYKSVHSSVSQMFDHLNLAPFPETLHFIFGTNLVTVYSQKNSNDNLILFPDIENEFGGISGMTFGRINGEWIVW